MKYLLQIVVIVLFPLIFGKILDLDEENETVSTAYPEHIAGAYTGGFGEQSCHSCHFDYDLNQPEGNLSVSGIGESFEPGKEYQIGLKVERDDLAKAGFQMTARFSDSTQAGSFEIGENLTTTPNIENDISYVQHGVGLVEAENGEKSWQVSWIAPDQKKPVIINIAANAANGDASEFGDWIYLKEIIIEPDL